MLDLGSLLQGRRSFHQCWRLHWWGLERSELFSIMSKNLWWVGGKNNFDFEARKKRKAMPDCGKYPSFKCHRETDYFPVWAFIGNEAYRTSVTNTLYRCSNNYWCCSAGGNITSCCNDFGVENVLFTLGGSEISNGSAWASGLALVPASAMRTSLPTDSKLTQSCPTQSCPPQPIYNEHSETRKAGLAVGFGTGVPLLIAFSVAIVLLRREKRSGKLLRQQLSAEVVQPVISAQVYEWKAPSEMSAREADVVREMPAGSGIVPELYANPSGR